MNSFQRVPWKRNKRLRLILGLGFGLAPGPRALAEEASWLQDKLQPSLSLRLGAFEHSKDENEEDPVYPAAVWLTLRPELPADVHVYLEGVQRWPGAGDKPQAELREGYVEKSFGPLDAKIGRQIIVWGRADKINPTDQLSSKDLRRLSSDDEEQRLGIGATQWTLNAGAYRLIGVWQYEWRRPLFPEFKTSPGLVLEQEDPADSDQQFALKLDHSGGQVDWSLSGFQGYSHVPDLAIRANAPDGIRLALYHQKIRVIGGDLAFNAFDIGWRGEIAHTQTEDEHSREPLMQNPFTLAVWGGDKNLIENLNLNVQIFARQVARDEQVALDPLTKALQAQLKTRTQQRHRHQDGLSLRLNYKAWQETLEFETALVWNRQDNDRTIRPKLSYAWTDHLKSMIGAELYYGSKESFFGQLHDVSSAFAELRYSL